MKMHCIAIVSCCLTVSLVGGCRNNQRDVKNSVSVVSEMATAAAKGDYIGGIAIGENYLHENPGDTNVLEQTAILTLAQAKQDKNNREPLVARAVLLLERSVKSSHPQKDNADRFLDPFMAARGFEAAGDLSSDKCQYYGRALALNSEAGAALNVESFKSGDEEAISTKPLKEQSRRLQSELEKRMAESRCGTEPGPGGPA
jgi:hypothetical protein